MRSMSRWVRRRIYIRTLSAIFLLFSFPVGGSAHYDIGVGKYFKKDHFHEHKVCSGFSPLADCSVSVEGKKSLAGSFAQYKGNRLSDENPDYEINHVHVEQSSELVASNQDDVQFFSSRLGETVFATLGVVRIESKSNICFSPNYSPYHTRAPPSV